MGAACATSVAILLAVQQPETCQLTDSKAWMPFAQTQMADWAVLCCRA